jgi:starch-binding outer membrane protein, SusD/RagB family
MKYNHLCLLLLSCLLFSCEDWLTEEPKSTKPIGGTTAVDAQASVDGIYAFLRAPYDKGGYANMAYSILEVATDQYKASAIDDFGAAEVYNLVYTTSNPHFANWWNSCYRGIEAANIAISTIPTITDPKLSDNQRSQLMGEAHFLRAYYYFMLVRMFGDIPLKVTPTTSEADGQIGKSPVKDIYEKVIVPDLLLAEEQNLPATSQAGRVSNGAVKALLAKVYLTMAGYPLQQTDKYALAKEKAREVMDGRYSLFQSDANRTWFNKLNNSDFDNQQEHIFMVQYAVNLVSNSISIYFAPLGGTGVLTPSGIHFAGMYPTDKFYNSYQENDLRAQNQGFFFTEYDGIKFELSVYKYFDPSLRTVAPQGDKNVPLIRYADVLLTYAEAQNAADGSPDATSYEAINAIRARSGLEPLSGLSGQAFTEAVWRERAWELTVEGQVWFDMLRTRKIFNGTGFQDVVGYTLSNGKTIGEQHLQFLIPQSELDVNPRLAQ